MGNYFRVFSFVFFSFVLSSCTNEAPQNIPNIIGTVTDKDGNLINDVSVYFIYHFSDVQPQQISKVAGVDTVNFLYFTAVEQNSDIVLNWGAASELNNRGFEVRRKYGSSDYSTIAFVAGNGTSNTQHDYTYIDNNVSTGTYYYQLKQIDFDGNFQFSQEVMIKTSYYGPDTLYQNYPNPFDNYTKINFSLSEKDSTLLNLLNYYSLSPLYNFINKEFEPGAYSVQFSNLENYPNDIYKVKYILIENNTTKIEQERDMFINRTLINELLTSRPNIRTENGRFEMDISSLPIHKIINQTSEYNWTTIGKKEVTNLVTFVLVKSGYTTLELDYSIDEFNQNDFTFRMEKQ